jgi:DNA polymerase-3 subunit alpha
MILQVESRRLGFMVLPPDVNRSAECFSVQDGHIRFGLEAVKGVGRGAVEAILEAREQGPFESIWDFAERVDPAKVNRKCLENLIQAGSMDVLGMHRGQLFESISTAVEWSARRRKEKDMGQVSLFAAAADAPPAHPPLPEVDEWKPSELLRREKEAVGFYVSGHPMEEHRVVLGHLGVVPIHLLDTLPDHEAILAAGLPTLVRKSYDKRGNGIAFMTLEDFTGTVECLVFNDAYEGCKGFLEQEVPLMIRGRISTREDQKPKLRVEEAVPLTELQSRGQLTLHLALTRTADDSLLQELCALLDSHPGSSPVWIHVDPLALEGVQIRLRAHRVDPSARLLDELQKRIGDSGVRLTVGEPIGTRSQEIFLVESSA